MHTAHAIECMYTNVLYACAIKQHTHRSTTRKIKNCMDILYSTLSHSQFANPWVTVVHVTVVLFTFQQPGSLTAHQLTLHWAIGRRFWPVQQNTMVGERERTFTVKPSRQCTVFFHGAMTALPSEITAFIAIHLSEIYCLGNIMSYKSPWGKPFIGFLTMIHPDRHPSTTLATDEGKYFLSNRTFQPMVWWWLSHVKPILQGIPFIEVSHVNH